MRLPDQLTVDNLESAYRSWKITNDPNLTLPLSLSAPLPFCIEAPLLQLIASASRKAGENFAVHFEGLAISDEDYETILKNSLGNTHVLCAWIMASKIFDSNLTSISKSHSQSFSKYLDAMDSYDFLKTHATPQMRVNLICVQGAQREFIQPLYHEVKNKMVVRPYSDVRLFVQDILAQLASSWTGKKLREVSAPLAQLVQELMENADWWARTDEAGVPYKRGKSFRVLSFRLVDIDDDNAANFGGSNHHLQSYLQTILLEQGESDGGESSSRKRSIKRSSFIELSVVDSGPGLARRWLSSQDSEFTKRLVADLETISMADEEKAVVDCFKKWSTSSHSSVRGIGLFSVARMLREKNGFMRLRTGRLAYLFGTQSATKDVEQRMRGKGEEGKATQYTMDDGTHVFMEDSDVAFFLRPWNKETLSPVEGTSYSILLPV